MKSIAKWDAIKFGWMTFKKQPWLIIAITFAVWFIPQIVQTILQIPLGVKPFQVNQPSDLSPLMVINTVIISIISILMSAYFSLAAVVVALKLVSGNKIAFEDLFRVKVRHFLMYILAGLLCFLAFVPLMVLFFLGTFFIPKEIQFLQGILFFLFFVFVLWAAIKLLFYSYILVDKNVNALEALKQSFRMTSGYEFHLFLFILVIVGVTILGALALIVGLLVAVPVTWIAEAYVYRKLATEATATQATKK